MSKCIFWFDFDAINRVATDYEISPPQLLPAPAVHP